MTALVILALVALFALGAPIFAIMLAAGAYGAVHTSGDRGFWQDFGNQVADIANLGTGEPAQIFSTIPLFIFMGFLMAESRTADRMVRFAQSLLGWLPGGLAVVTIFACAIFTTFTGASGVTIVALGGLVMPSLLKERYPERFSLGLVAGTGSVGLLFPPALPLFIYGTIYGIAAQTQGDTGQGEMQLIDFSTGRFLFAGLVPGLVLLGILSLFAIFVAVKRGVPRQRFDVAALGKNFVVALPEIVLPALIIGGIVSGITIPEIAALAAVYTLVIEMFLYRDLAASKLWGIVRESMVLVGAIFIIIFASAALTNFFITADVHNLVFDWLTATFESKWTFLLALNVFLLLVGMMMDIFSAIVVVVPLIYLPAQKFGIDPYHLGIIFLLNLEIGYLTPPVGLNLFITGFSFRRPIPEVIRATLPFLGCMVLALVLVVRFESLTVVPEAERRGRVSQIAREVQDAARRLSSVQALEMPDGSTLEVSACDELSGLDREECRGVFLGVTRCRQEHEGIEAIACEEEILEAYAASRAAVDDAGDGDWSLDGEAGDGDTEPAEGDDWNLDAEPAEGEADGDDWDLDAEPTEGEADDGWDLDAEPVEGEAEAEAEGDDWNLDEAEGGP